MNDFDKIDVIWLVAVLIAAIASLSVRRLSLGMVARSLASWALIGLLAYIAVAHRYELQDMLGRVTASLGIDEQQVEGKIVRIRKSPDGHFYARVTVNGVEKRMLIDSGATITAMSDTTAATLGVRASGGLPAIIQTANGTVEAQRGRIGELAIGGLVARDLGVVISPAFGETDVLGMNFLSRLQSWRVEGNTLVLDPGDADAGGSAEDQSAEASHAAGATKSAAASAGSATASAESAKFGKRQVRG